ncbi:MAG: hypothetical protein JXR49_09410 [Acidobacteria bacterium]|nr:hypothetical protein [Acidobacteriota bacterium]
MALALFTLFHPQTTPIIGATAKGIYSLNSRVVTIIVAATADTGKSTANGMKLFIQNLAIVFPVDQATAIESNRELIKKKAVTSKTAGRKISAIPVPS